MVKINQSFYSLNLLCFLLIAVSVLMGCNKEDSESDLCKDIPTLDGEVTFNGQKEKLSVAQLLSFGGSYMFTISSIASGCTELNSISFTIEDGGNDISGTYQFGDFFYSGDDTIFGTFITQKIEGLSQALLEIESGTLKIEDMGGNKFFIDIDAVATGGDMIQFQLTHDF